MNRVLIVAYYTPPLGLSGVMRVTKLAKYLPDFGWEPVILTVRPVAYYAYDPELSRDLNRAVVFRTESLDPNRLLYQLGIKGRTRLKFSSGPGISRLSNLIFFPDSKIGWLPFALSTGRRLVNRLKPRVIFATAPPWTCLVIGLRLARASGLPFVADFRDPWPAGFRTPPFYQRGFIRRLRDKILNQAELILTVNRGTAERLVRFSEDGEWWGGVRKKMVILENGFDPEEFAVVPEKPGKVARVQKRSADSADTGDEEVGILYAGNLWENRAEIKSFLSALQEVPSARFYIAGRVDEESARMLMKSPQVVLLGLVPHARAIALMKGADFLLYIGKSEQPVGLKLYEYLGAERPIILWGNGEDEAGEIIKELCAGAVCADGASLRNFIQEIKQQPGSLTISDRSRFNRRVQAERLAGYLNRLGWV